MNIHFKRPGKIEAIAMMVMLFTLFGLYQAANLYLVAGSEWRPHFSANFDLPGAVMFWFFFLVFHAASMFTAARGVLSKAKSSTWNGFDFTVGFMMVVGLYLIAISTIYGVFKGEPNIEFLWDLKYPMLMNIGFALEAVGMIWFAVTD